ncbi:chromo domain containing protein [Niveomyces insectorum RCEF 264]|uniref:Chromo domain containing protein n=1 Tax=Niveomyces insectorum RCEF 264 TaxID=1081102 RepID=A0A167TCG2_9HYPO|nr:chromo domain containing protein [Niveomyces insectorum RCEF 264]
MPPALSDDEMSDASGVGAVTTPPPPSSSKRGKKLGSYDDDDNNDDDDDNGFDDGGKAKRRGAAGGRSKQGTPANGTAPAATATAGGGARAAAAKNAAASDENEDEDEDDEDDDEEAEDEYEVQEIIGHMLDENNNPRFRVVWKGYEDPSDHTWEPEDNLKENASEILTDYIFKIGGLEKLYEKPAKGRKRGASSGAGAGAGGATTAKRVRQSGGNNGTHPADRASPGAVAKAFKPPAGSWEDDVVDVEMFRGDDGELRVFLTWKNGSKSQHSAQQTYVRCPQKILRFYESRISFKQATE